MLIDILTIFPKMFEGVFNESILKIAQKKNIIKIRIHNIRDYSLDKHKKVDDKPYGGGAGMVMGVEPIFEAVSAIRQSSKKRPLVILLTPRGKKFDQRLAKTFSKERHIILIAGHYEGVDERVVKLLRSDEVSIGDYVLTGGELPAMVIVDAITRLQKGALGNKKSCITESFETNLIEHPHFTRPPQFKGKRVPEVLLKGDHKKIAEWREKESIKVTRKRRPDLLKSCE